MKPKKQLADEYANYDQGFAAGTLAEKEKAKMLIQLLENILDNCPRDKRSGFWHS